MQEAIRGYLSSLATWPVLVLIVGYVSCGLVETLVPAFRRPAQRVDRWPSNWALMFGNTSMASLVPVSALWGAEQAQATDVGLLHVVHPGNWATVLFTLAVLSLNEYVQHVAFHKIPWFWRVHRVHHLDTHLDISTAGRHHPFELLLSLSITVPLVYMLGPEPEVLAGYLLVDAIMSAAAHANIRLPQKADRLLCLVLVTPNMHSIHHSATHRETDSNYGEVFTFWDRLFGTYRQVPRERYDLMTIGLREVQDGRAADLWWQLKSPLLQKLSK